MIENAISINWFWSIDLLVIRLSDIRPWPLICNICKLIHYQIVKLRARTCWISHSNFSHCSDFKNSKKQNTNHQKIDSCSLKKCQMCCWVYCSKFKMNSLIQKIISKKTKNNILTYLVFYLLYPTTSFFIYFNGWVA